ncbi:hypothetical protein BK658_23675 [Pseudomonas brassicacearum]|uniref:Uncharacterized protein n=1 Tax=Pseudomonas brassicacearum TaxID=930166 RepID=A0A423GLF5_9PSED|nr:hypothetical protein BK658_23675 [Pseudomonas brassicacearum]
MYLQWYEASGTVLLTQLNERVMEFESGGILCYSGAAIREQARSHRFSGVLVGASLLAMTIYQITHDYRTHSGNSYT